MKNSSLFIASILIFITACSTGNDKKLQFENRQQAVPDFNTDSAHTQLVAQVDFGPRNPGSEAHQQTKNYLVNRLKKYAGDRYVFTQKFKHRGYEGDTLQMANIIAAFNPQSKDRIMLCAHWDTRPRADRDSVNSTTPILGADDGASGVAVLLELARIFSKEMPPIGVDIVLFDGEDYGKEGDFAQYFLGSRFWSNYPPVKNYNPRFAILVDMVGGRNAQFLKEGYSLEFAPALVKEVWGIAEQKGYEKIFIDAEGAKITDDHLVINRIRKIPTIDIINHSVDSEGSVEFTPYWHTSNDNLDIIDKKTLKAVGEVLAELVYNRI